MYKLVAVDIDGTLLNSKGELTLNVKNTVEEAFKEGFVFTPCTGRGPIPLKAVTDKFDVDMPLICFNGAQVIKGKSGEIIYESPLSKEDAMFVYNEGVKRGVGVVLWTLDNKLAFNEMNEHTNHYLKNSGYSKDDIYLVEEHMELFDERIAKVLWQDDPKKIDDYIVQGRELLQGRKAVCATSQNFLLEFTHEEATKAKGIEHLAMSYNIKREETIAIGDGLNDIAMIEYASLGVAMGNAHKDVIKVADYIAPTNDEDGVAYIINKYMLGR